MWTYNYAGYSDELYHHGVLGMKWGHRKAVSGSAIGNRMLAANTRGAAKVYGKLGNHALASIQSSQAKQYSKKADAAQAKADARASDPKHKADVARKIKIGVAVAGTALAAYGAYRFSKWAKEKANATVMERGKKAVESNLAFDKAFYREAWHQSMGNGSTPNRIMQNSIIENWSKSRARAASDTDEYRRAAKDASKNTYQAVKTLLGKNRRFTRAELRQMGISVFDLN